VTKQAINPAALFRSLEHGFSQAVVASGTRTLYISGQTAWDAGGSIAFDCGLVMRNIPHEWETAKEMYI
jgi:enamine deaminase RidA (YjgF/YER057c/UK114 family)